MTQAARSLQTLQVTAAVRDARIGRRKVKRGEHIVLAADEGLLAAHAERDAAILQGLRRLKPGFELVTLYHGAGVTRGEAEALAELIAGELDGVETEIVDGGQPHYSFLISAE